MPMKWTYEKAGVSLKAGDDWVKLVKKAASIAQDSRVVSGVGGFSGLYDLGKGLYLAACCDGVGTKLEIAKKAGDLEVSRLFCYFELGSNAVATSGQIKTFS